MAHGFLHLFYGPKHFVSGHPMFEKDISQKNRPGGETWQDPQDKFYGYQNYSDNREKIAQFDEVENQWADHHHNHKHHQHDYPNHDYLYYNSSSNSHCLNSPCNIYHDSNNYNLPAYQEHVYQDKKIYYNQQNDHYQKQYCEDYVPQQENDYYDNNGNNYQHNEPYQEYEYYDHTIDNYQHRPYPNYESCGEVSNFHQRYEPHERYEYSNDIRNMCQYCQFFGNNKNHY